MKPSTVKNIRLRQPNRLDSQPVIGVATAVATRLSVITQEISSCVADRLPRICGSTRLASVMVMPNSMLASCTINRMSHCRPLIVKIPPFSAMAVMRSRRIAVAGRASHSAMVMLLSRMSLLQASPSSPANLSISAGVQSFRTVPS